MAWDPEQSELFLKLGHGELPTALQFLSNGERTGLLEISCKGVTSTGQVFFKNGRIIHVETDMAMGLEALAQLMSCTDYVIHFYADESTEFCELDMSTDSLIMEATVIADENQSLWYVESEAKPSLSISGHLKRFHRKHGKTAGIAAACGIGIASLAFGVLSSEPEQPASTASTLEPIPEPKTKAMVSDTATERENVARLINDAKRLTTERRYVAARYNYERVTTIEPENKIAVKRMAELERYYKEEAETEKVRIKAQQLVDEVADYSPNQKVGQKIEAVKKWLNNGDALYTSLEYCGAFETFQEVITDCREIVRLEESRKKAKEFRVKALRTKMEARKLGMNLKDPVAWEEAAQYERNANEAYEDGIFDQAHALWTEAYVKYAKQAKGYKSVSR